MEYRNDHTSVTSAIKVSQEPIYSNGMRPSTRRQMVVALPESQIARVE